MGLKMWSFFMEASEDQIKELASSVLKLSADLF